MRARAGVRSRAEIADDLPSSRLSLFLLVFFIGEASFEAVHYSDVMETLKLLAANSLSYVGFRT
jgi:hypothetical protein